MTIAARLARLEVAIPPVQSLSIMAIDTEDFDRQFTDALLGGVRVGLLKVAATIAGETFEDVVTVHGHEDRL